MCSNSLIAGCGSATTKHPCRIDSTARLADLYSIDAGRITMSAIAKFSTVISLSQGMVCGGMGSLLLLILLIIMSGYSAISGMMRFKPPPLIALPNHRSLLPLQCGVNSGRSYGSRITIGLLYPASSIKSAIRTLGTVTALASFAKVW